MRTAASLVGWICVALAAQMAAAAVPVVESAPSTGSTASSTSRSAAGSSAPSSSSGNVVRAYGADTAQIVSTEPMDVVRAAPPSQSVGGSVGSAAAAAPVATPTGSSTSILFQQLQQLQDEVAELRGTVEEQAHQIQQLKADQKEQYLDIDRRLSALQGGAPAAGPAPTGGVSTTGPTGPAAPTGGTTVGGSGAANSERDAYTRAFNLMKDKRFSEAISSFNEMLVTYPKGEYAGNAYYWLGEAYRATGAPEKARQSFAQVVNQYPNNPKISDAMYKLGVVYNELGDRAKALEYLKRVQSQYPGTSAASLAQSYAAELR